MTKKYASPLHTITGFAGYDYEAKAAMQSAHDEDIKRGDTCYVIHGAKPDRVIPAKFKWYTLCGASLCYYDEETGRWGPRVWFNWQRGDRIFKTMKNAKIRLLMDMIGRQTKHDIESAKLGVEIKALMEELECSKE